jgi:outer membrane protein assembly factor BamB
MQRRTRNWHLVLILVIGALACGQTRASDWPRFRGPNGTGVSTDKDVPVTWSADNVLWKKEIPGIGHSSPIVHGGRILLQSASKDGKERWLFALEGATGEMLWKTTVPGDRPKRKPHDLNSLASSTPATDGERVYALFWDGRELLLGAYQFRDGKVVWEKRLGGFVSQHGVGHSPMLIDGKVIVANDQDGSAHLLAFDTRSGDKVWDVERKAFRACYSTPFVHARTDGGKELIVASTAGITGYNPSDGSVNWSYTWSFSRMPLRTVASPIANADLVFATSGDGAGDRHAIAVRLGGKGDVTDTSLVWENRKKYPFPYVPCMLARGDYLYSVSDKGMANCHLARTGDEVWSENLNTAFTASPILVDGKVYAVSQSGSVYIFEAAPKFKLLAKNSLDEPVSSTPAVADNRLYIRGDKHLFCVGKPAAAAR